MKIEILYLDKFKFEFEEKLFTIYLERLKKISKNQFSQINTLKINHKKLSERLLRNRMNQIIIILDIIENQKYKIIKLYLSQVS